MRGTAVVAHGAGSSADFVRRAFGRPLAEHGLDLVTWDDRSGDVDRIASAMSAWVEVSGARVVGGVSIGAHAAVRCASTTSRSLDGLLLALPAWSGVPDDAVARASAAAADQVAAQGIRSACARVHDDGWVGHELAAAWSGYGLDELVGSLRRASASSGPTAAELTCLRMPVGIVAVADDPMHPVAVAQDWARRLLRGTVVVLEQAEVAADRATLGRAALSAAR